MERGNLESIPWRECSRPHVENPPDAESSPEGRAGRSLRIWMKGRREAMQGLGPGTGLLVGLRGSGKGCDLVAVLRGSLAFPLRSAPTVRTSAQGNVDRDEVAARWSLKGSCQGLSGSRHPLCNVDQNVCVARRGSGVCFRPRGICGVTPEVRCSGPASQAEVCSMQLWVGRVSVSVRVRGVCVLPAAVCLHDREIQDSTGSTGRGLRETCFPVSLCLLSPESHSLLNQ